MYEYMSQIQGHALSLLHFFIMLSIVPYNIYFLLYDKLIS